MTSTFLLWPNKSCPARPGTDGGEWPPGPFQPLESHELIPINGGCVSLKLTPNATHPPIQQILTCPATTHHRTRAEKVPTSPLVVVSALLGRVKGAIFGFEKNHTTTELRVCGEMK